MVVKIDCPRCKKSSSFPGEQAGSYVNCPNCNGRVWVPKEETGDAAPGMTVPTMTAVPSASAPPPVQEIPPANGPAAGGPESPPVAPPVVTNPQAVPPASPPKAPAEGTPVGSQPKAPPEPPPKAPPVSQPKTPPEPPPKTPSASQPKAPPASQPKAPPASQPKAPPETPSQAPTVSQPEAPPAEAPKVPKVTPPVMHVPGSGKKVARFISAETAQSTLTIAEDGQLPELQLSEGTSKKKKSDSESTTVNPLVLFGAISISVVFSIILVLYDTGSGSTSGGKRRQEARSKIAFEYLPDAGQFDDPDTAPRLEEYQKLIRAAQRAYSRGDLKAEREYYRKVLSLLRSEQGTTDDAPGDPFRNKKFVGITGSPSDDRELEELISDVISRQ